jgi:NUMOD3 motif
MKICWDNLEKLKYNKRTGKWLKGTNKYVYIDECENCHEPYLQCLSNIKRRKASFCCVSCSSSGKNNPNYNTHRTKETKRKISIAQKGKKRNQKFTEETRKKLSEAHKGENHWNYKGGYHINNIPAYDTYANQIECAEEVRRNKEDKNILEVKCTYCGKWFIPKMRKVQKRILSLKGKTNIENRFYCSYDCKNLCSVFNKTEKQYIKEQNGEINLDDLKREVQPELRKMRLEIDEYKCIKCGSEENLHCHHIEGIRWNPLESADLDMVVMVCEKCHMEIHKIPGCRYIDMQCSIEDFNI